ncbi:MAG: capsule assembly Wzi family protein [Candidatus Sulfotelmatobacter sp.]|jgi:membrane-associated phospholipid phosphatase
MKFTEPVLGRWKPGCWTEKLGVNSCALVAIVLGCSLMASAQTPADEKPTPAPSSRQVENSPDLALLPVDLKSLPRNLFQDQKNFWSTPFHMTTADLQWAVPLAFAGAALVASDTAIEKHVPTDPSTVSHAVTASNAGLAAFAAVGGGMFVLGHFAHNDQERETGLLSGEAGIDAFLDTEVFAYALGRDRPFTGNGRGQFFQGGDSFPSDHAAISWAIASVIAHEYPGPMTELLAYGMAGGVSAARLVGQKHFASDVVVGSALGWYLGRQVFRSHSHYSDAEIAKWGTFSKNEEGDNGREARNMGSPYVPLDSWVYPAMDRLTALGYVHSGFADMRPWTRMECARQIKEAANRMTEDETTPPEVERLYQALQREFGPEITLLAGGDNAELRLESAYTRSTEIVGEPLTDGDHFGQTIVNDFGRPEEQGFNNVSGLSGWAAYGPLAVYVRGEYQHSPSAPALPLTARDAISVADFSRIGLPSGTTFPVPPDTPISPFNEGRFLDTYVALNLSDWQLSYGNQSLWWGPSQGGPMMFSDNAAPIRMFRVNRVTPFTLPSFLGLFGPMRLEAFLGQYSGYEFVDAPSGLVGQYGQSLNPQPIVHGERISFKPTSNLEIGLSRTTDYGGPGYPLTLHTFLRSVFSTSNTFAGNPNKPGARRSGMDFSYRIPGLRDGMTFYAEGLAEHDEITPILGPDVAAWLAGIYVPRLPAIPKLDFRVEGGYTDPPNSGGDVAHGAFYWDPAWVTGFQNAGHLMGSWMGRQGQGAEAWTTYWFSPRNKLQFGFRHQKVSQQFIPNGGTLADANVRAEFWPRSSFSLSASVQYERWSFPVVATTRQSNVSSTVQLSFWPKELWRRNLGQ